MFSHYRGEVFHYTWGFPQPSFCEVVISRMVLPWSQIRHDLFVLESGWRLHNTDAELRHLISNANYASRQGLKFPSARMGNHEKPLGELTKCKVKHLSDLMKYAHLYLTHWGRMMHICGDNMTIIGSDNGSSPGRRQAIIWTNAWILLIGPLGTNFSENLIEIHTFSFKKMHLKMSSAKWRPFCLGLNVLMAWWRHEMATLSALLALANW